MSEKYNLDHSSFSFHFFNLSNQILGQFDLVLYSLESLTFACTLEAQSS